MTLGRCVYCGAPVRRDGTVCGKKICKEKAAKDAAK